MSDAKREAKAVAEIVFDAETGELLWIERYHLTRAHGVGETFIRQSKSYTVCAFAITYGELGGGMVEYKVRRG